MLGNKLESLLDRASLHPPHFVLHFVKIEVKCRVFLPDSERSDQANICYVTFAHNLTHLDQFTGALHRLAG